jgi:NAD(P)-dependent dehydrogenase (short-subunit alcohol dehydrogenase family)
MTGSPRWLITGASSGIGRAMAIQVASRGWRIALTARRADQLAETADLVRVAGGQALELVGSVADPNCVRDHAERLLEVFGGVDVAVLNAGVGVRQSARQFDAEAYRYCADINYFGVCHWIESVLPLMLAGGGGVIAGVSSPAGWRGFPRIGPYSASKAALSAMLESLRIELAGSGVHVLTVFPGFVRTEMTAQRDPELMPGLIDADVAARQIVSGIDNRRRYVFVPHHLAWPLRWVLRLAPDALYDVLARRMRRYTD